MISWQDFTGLNLAYVLDLYERYQKDPGSFDETTRDFFNQWIPPEEPGLTAIPAGSFNLDKAVAAANLAQSIRAYGYLGAKLNPLRDKPAGDPYLELDYYQLTEEDLRGLPASLVSTPSLQTGDALQAIQTLRRIYSSTIGYDYGHIRIPGERQWLRAAAEKGIFRPPRMPVNDTHLLERLTQVEVFENFLHRIFPGKTRFSIEGLDMLVPMLDVIISLSAEAEICMILLGMPHRGRLNVMAHVLQKPYEQILAEFKDPRGHWTTWDKLGWTGDVKYHKGAQFQLEDAKIVELVVKMPPNPSHLEHINPVIEGMARSADTAVDQPGEPVFYPNASLPILIHGDASFTGEGVEAETLNLSALPGYQTAGTIHVIANNQLGFTADEVESRSSQFASDLAKGYEIPVMHVNADDPLGCIEATHTAFAYRQKYHKDFLIDLIGYRRYGHNEGDEPAFTQPLMYDFIRAHPSVRQIWADRLVENGEIKSDFVEELFQKGMQALQAINDRLQADQNLVEPYPVPPPPGAAQTVKTGVAIEVLQALNEALLTLPEEFNLNRKLQRAMQRRMTIFDQLDQATIDWATAEALAFATILWDGIPIRLTGEDVARGTFSQRHAVFHDVENGHTYIPLQAIPQARASFEVHNSPLTENATVGFEFGYNIQAPERMVIWEAQYGDFFNIAQIMMDEFISSARAKWGQTPSLVLLLPHGNEGQGPDHSSARLERFLGLAAEINLRIAYPTTSAQYFHLLRRQAALLKNDPLPLIVFTPKGLLRHPLVASSPRTFVDGNWQPVIDDAERSANPEMVRRLVLCSGRIYYDLIASELRQGAEQLAILRVEQLYPFPEADLQGLLRCYSGVEDVLWVQEEPENMGAWGFVQPILEAILEGGPRLHFIGRPPSSSPAEGSTSWYEATQNALVKKVFEQTNRVETTIDATVLEKE
jgi:2-oxoglutarate dehydrogenase E1 component